MKKLIFLFSLLYLAIGTYAQLSKTIDLANAGTLSTSLTPSELLNVTNLTITGTIDARDFKTMRDDMPVLVVLDLGGVTIAAYEGTEGSWDLQPSEKHTYPANSIPDYTFYHYNRVAKTSLQSIILPSSTNSIGFVAFAGCTGIKSITIPSSVILISDAAFYLFVGSINVDASNPTYSSIDGVLYNKKQTVLIYYPRLKSGHFDIPGSVTSIGEAAFIDCDGLTSVTIPSSVTNIGQWLFKVVEA